jgi:hypothetical protein
MQLYVMKLVSVLWQVDGFIRVLFYSTNKTAKISS